MSSSSISMQKDILRVGEDTCVESSSESSEDAKPIAIKKMAKKAPAKKSVIKKPEPEPPVVMKKKSAPKKKAVEPEPPLTPEPPVVMKKKAKAKKVANDEVPKPKRELSLYNHFVRARMGEVRAENPGKLPKDCMIVIGMLWKEQKDFFVVE